MSEPPERHFASTTFCWLPPERLPQSAYSEWALIESLRIQSRASAYSSPTRSTPPFA